MDDASHKVSGANPENKKKGCTIKVSKNNHQGINFVICVGCSDLVNLSCVPARTWKLCAGSVDASPCFEITT